MFVKFTDREGSKRRKRGMWLAEKGSAGRVHRHQWYKQLWGFYILFRVRQCGPVRPKKLYISIQKLLSLNTASSLEQFIHLLIYLFNKYDLFMNWFFSFIYLFIVLSCGVNDYGTPLKVARLRKIFFFCFSAFLWEALRFFSHTVRWKSGGKWIFIPGVSHF